MDKQFYTTTAIDYVNGHPHLGHAYEKVITDVISRAQQALGREAFFLTGLDEHGQKVQQAAEAKGMDSQVYCDELAEAWESFAGKLNLSNKDFVRTTQARHKKVVQTILQKLHAEGHFYQSEYRGYYSTRQETFLTEKDRDEEGNFDPIYGEVVELVENNYYFKLGAHQQWLIDYIEEHPNFISPEYRRNEVLGFLKNNTLEDLCITRPKQRLSWGIPLPFDEDYVTYVWFDALTNYITVPAAQGDQGILGPLGLKPEDLGAAPETSISLWPADAHVIGKDILKFHAVYWPIMLKAMGVELPKQVLVHGWWQKDGEKISKATGNIVDPCAVIDEWGLDAFRFYVVRELDIGPDGNWTDEGFATRYTAELANGLGNLMNRSLKMLGRYRDGVLATEHDELKDEASKAVSDVKKALEAKKLQAGIRRVLEFITFVNQYVDQTAPFKLAKDPEQAGRLDEVLYNLVESCRILSIMIWPFLPDTAVKMFGQVGLEGEPNLLAAAEWGGLKSGHKIGEPEPLFPRKDR